MNLTINELAHRSGLSAYEIRRRVQIGAIPHIRIGTKNSKVLIDEETFNRLLAEESRNNMNLKHTQISSVSNDSDTVGYDRLRKID